MQSSIAKQLFWSHTILVVLLAGVAWVLVETRGAQASQQLGLERLRDMAVLVRAHVLAHAPGDAKKLQEELVELGQELGARVDVFDRENRVVASSAPAHLRERGALPELVDARERGSGSTQRFSTSEGEDMLYVALPLRAVEAGGGEPDLGALSGGAVRVALPRRVLEAPLAPLRRDLAFATLAIVFVILLLSMRFARGLSAPIRTMTRAAEALAAGDYSRQIDVYRDDELGKLAGSLRRSAASAQERMETITTDRNKLLAILGGMSEGVVAVDLDERVLHMNAVAAEILRAAPETSVGKFIWEATRVPDVSEIVGSVLQEQTSAQDEVRLLGTQRDRVIAVGASPIVDGDGDMAGAVLLLKDVTELQHLQAVRRDFVANVSHELKTPITAIRGLVETILDDPEMGGEIRDRFLGRVQDQAMRLSTLVSELLTLSRLQSEAAGLELLPVDLREPMQRAVGLLQSMAEERDVELVVELPPERLVVDGDVEALRQAIGNLVDNALKYTSRGGSVRLTGTREGDRAVIEVIDNGVGIEPLHQDRIFERFYRVDKARSRELGGTGLGLSIVKHVCLAHGGEVMVESQPGCGSRFTMFLPLRSQPAPAPV